VVLDVKPNRTDGQLLQLISLNFPTSADFLTSFLKDEGITSITR